MPLLHIRSCEIRVDRVQGRSIRIDQRIRREALIQEVDAGKGAIQSGTCRRTRTGIAERLRHKKRWVESCAGVGIGPVFLATIEDAVAGAQNRSLGQLVS